MGREVPSDQLQREVRSSRQLLPLRKTGLTCLPEREELPSSRRLTSTGRSNWRTTTVIVMRLQEIKTAEK